MMNLTPFALLLLTSIFFVIYSELGDSWELMNKTRRQAAVNRAYLTSKGKMTEAATISVEYNPSETRYEYASMVFMGLGFVSAVATVVSFIITPIWLN